MTGKKPLQEGYQPEQKGYQPGKEKVPGDGSVQNGYQPAKNIDKTTNPPPKKP